ncbi:MAG: SulP family inorganic anion transporter [Gemmatimonadota bacterium]
MSHEFEPKLVTVLKEGLPRAQLARDVGAGVLVGIVALPLAIAFAIASGVGPEQGLYTAIVAGFLISALSGSRVQIGGPTGAFVVLVYGIVQTHGYDGLAVATLMAGVLLITMGLARFGTLIQFVPYPVTVGFTAGIALVIASTQVRDALGLPLDTVPAGFVAQWRAFLPVLPQPDPWAVGLAGLTVLLLLGGARFAPRVPTSLLALLVTTGLVQALDLPVATIGSRFGSVAAGLPTFRLPRVPLEQVPDLLSPAVAIALLAGIESLLSAVVADGMTGRRHRSNMELIGQGVANVASPLFGGIPATGAIARTATNIKNGGRTPIAGMVHALTLLVILLVAGRWAALIPMATLAGILLVVAWNMSEARLFLRVLTASTRADALVLLVTFGLTVFVDLTAAIQVGVVLAALLFMKRMTEVTEMRTLESMLDEEDTTDPDAAVLATVPAGVEVFEVSGPFFFGAAHKFKSTLGTVRRRPPVLILRLRQVPVLDATGLRALEELAAQAERDGTRLVLSGVQPQPLALLERSGFVTRVGAENVTRGLPEAVARTRALLHLAPHDPVEDASVSA